MRTLLEIEAAIKQLSESDVRQLAAWLQSYLDETWDQQIEEDLTSGKLDNLIAQAEAEAKLLEKAARQGKDVATVAAELLASVLEWEAQDYEEAVEGIQRGLDDFEAGRFRSFEEFAEEQRRKYNLPSNS
ncbi:hypothetical protein NDI39_26350 [Microcoleus sp. ZQ-A2]